LWGDSVNSSLRGAYDKYENGAISKDVFKNIITKDLGIKLNPTSEHFIDSHYGGIGTFNKLMQVISSLSNYIIHTPTLNLSLSPTIWLLFIVYLYIRAANYSSRGNQRTKAI